MQQAQKTRKGWAAFGWSLIYPAITLASQVIAAIGLSIIYVVAILIIGIANGSMVVDDPYIFETLIDGILTGPLMGWILLVGWIITVGVCWLIARARRLDVRRFAGLTPSTPLIIGASLLLGVGFSLLLNSALTLPGMEVFQDPETSAAQAVLVGSLFTAIIGATVVPLAEEIVFRGFMMNDLRRGLTLIPSVLISSVFFGILHGTIAWAFMATIFGFVFAWVALRSRSVWPAVAAHAGLNGTSLTMMWLEPNGISVFAVVALMGTILLIATIAILVRNTESLSTLEPAPEPKPKPVPVPMPTQQMYPQYGYAGYGQEQSGYGQPASHPVSPYGASAPMPGAPVPMMPSYGQPPQYTNKEQA